MKYMTAKEEDILTTQSYIGRKVLDRLFQSLIIGNGEGEPIKYVDLVTGDKNAIMISRVLGYGKEYKVEVEDPFSPVQSRKKQSTLLSLQIKSMMVQIGELNKNEFEFNHQI